MRDIFLERENIEEIAKIHPTKVLNFFIPFLDHHFSLIQDDNFTDFKWSHEYGERSELEEYIYKCLFQLVIKASKNMSTGQTDLSQLLGRYKNNPNLIFNRIYANVLLGLDVSHADEAIDWILNNPAQKFQLGNNLEEPVWVLPGKIIDKFSPYCTQEKFERLETTIYYFPSGYNLEQVKSYLDRRRQNHYFPYWGRTQYHLLPRLDNSRIQNKSRQLIVVLDRIFDKYTERDFCNKINGIAGFVSSPIKNIHRLSNKAWKKLLTTDSSSFEEKRLRNDCTESSIKQFSSAFESAVTADPQRFASFALTLPVDIHEDYINALYRGLDNETNRTQSKLTEACKPCPIELVEQVINHFGPSKFSRALQHLLSSNITDISSMHVELLENIAKYSDDPQPHRLNIYHQRHPEELDDISSKDLYLNTINCTRGSAYIGLARKFWEDQEYSISHKYIIENALNDEHAAVRMATATLLLPMYNYDRDYAFNKFIELCRKDIRNALSYGSHYYFNNAFHSSHIEPFTSLVKVMIESKYNDVRMEGHKQVLARWFFNSLFCSEIQQELKSTNKEALLGYSSVIKDLLSEDIKESDYTQLKPIFEILANSEDEEVQKTIGMLFNNKFWSKRFARDFFEIYIHSKAFNNNIEFILYSLEDTSINIADFSPLLLTMIKSINQLNIQGHINYLEIEVVTKIIQQLYDQAENDADEEVLNYCLDMWDELLASNLASLATVTNKIDCGLLS